MDFLYRIAGRIASAFHLASESTFAKKTAEATSSQITRDCPELMGFKDYNSELGKGRKGFVITFAMSSATLERSNRIGMIGFQVELTSPFESKEPDTGWSADETEFREAESTELLDAVISVRYYHKRLGGGEIPVVGTFRTIGYMAIEVNNKEDIEAVTLPDNFCDFVTRFIEEEVLPVAPQAITKRPLPVWERETGQDPRDAMWVYVSKLTKWLKHNMVDVVYTEELLNDLEVFVPPNVPNPRVWATKHNLPPVHSELLKVKLKNGQMVQVVNGHRPVPLE